MLYGIDAWVLLFLVVNIGPWVLLAALFMRTRSLGANIATLTRTVRTLTGQDRPAGAAPAGPGPAGPADRDPDRTGNTAIPATARQEAPESSGESSGAGGAGGAGLAQRLAQHLSSWWPVWLGMVAVPLLAVFYEGFEPGDLLDPFTIPFLAFSFGPWVLMAVLFVRTRTLGADLAALTRTVRALTGQGRPAGNTAPEPVGTTLVETTPVETGPVGTGPVETAGRAPDRVEKTAIPAVSRQPAASGSTPPAPPTGLAERLEHHLSARWLVWLGAVTVALGSAFLIRHSVATGWLSPTVRVMAGLGLAAGLIVGGEWLRRQPLSRAIAARRPDYIPPALTGSGLFAAFASLYGAGALYGLVAPAVAFAGLAATGLLGVGLSLLQGPFMAVIGLAGGFATPMLVAFDEPAIWPLLAHLLVLVGAGLFVVRYRGWSWLAWTVLAGAVLWTLPWLLSLPGSTAPARPLAVALYLLSIAALTILVPGMPPLATPGHESPPQGDPLSQTAQTAQGALPVQARTAGIGTAGIGPADRFRIVSACLVALPVLAFTLADGWGAASLVTLFLIAAGYLVAGRWRQSLTPLPLVALGLVLVAMSVWGVFTLELRDSAVPFLAVSAGFAVLFGAGGFAAFFGARQPALWSGLATAGPLLLLSLAYWLTPSRLGAEAAWAAVALLLAGLGVAAAALVGRYRQVPAANLALGIHAAGTVAALSLAGTMVLENAWLTVALSLQLPALAWLSRHLHLPGLRSVAAIVALTVLARLAFNPVVLDYGMASAPGAHWVIYGGGSAPGVHWVLYGYGIPAAACGLAAVWFRAGGTGRLTTLLEANMLVFAVLLVTFQIRHLVAGSIPATACCLPEYSLQSIAWLTIALALLHTDNRRRAAGSAPPGSPIRSVALLHWGWRILLAAASAQILVRQLVTGNPLWSPVPVGSWPVVNLLLLTYGAPALLFVLIARAWPEGRYRRFWSGLGYATGLLLGMVWLSLELRHAFQGSRLDGAVTGDAEWYGYSALWLAVAATLMGLGLWRASIGLRQAALAIFVCSIAKVFLFDAAVLTGLYRVASFFGLGLCLIGTGYLYQRTIAPTPPTPARQPPA